MDPIFERLGMLFRSFLQTEKDYDTTYDFEDQDTREAWEELEEFLKTGKNTQGESGSQSSSYHRTRYSTQEEILLKEAYMVLGLSPGVSYDELKKRQKELLRKYHPDRHTQDDKKMKEATKKSQAINEAYQFIKKKDFKNK